MPLLHFLDGTPCECDEIVRVVTTVHNNEFVFKETALPCLITHEYCAEDDCCRTSSIIPGVNSRGSKEGLSIEFFRDGSVRSVEPFVNGKVHGMRKCYKESGVLYDESLYMQGNFCSRSAKSIYCQRFPVENYTK